MSETTTKPPVSKKPGVARGAWTIAAIFAVGIAVTVGLFLSPRTTSPPVPANIVEGFPKSPVAIVVVDAGEIGPQPQRVIDAIARVHPRPDVIMLLGVDSSMVPPVAEVYGMQASFHPQLFQRVKEPDGSERRGVCILSKWDLYAGAPVKTVDGRIVGVQTVATIDGRTFRLLCLNSEEPFVANETPRAGVTAIRAAGGLDYRMTPPMAMQSPPVTATYTHELPTTMLLTLGPQPTSSPATTRSTESPAATQAAP